MLIGCFFFLGFLAILGLMTLILGNVHGEEFSPQSFCVREFSYYRFPIVRQRITATDLPTPAGTLACSPAISANLSTGIGTNGPIRWDLAEHSIGANTSLRGEASILLTYLRSPAWETWSTDKPKLAKVLWPALQELGIQRCYFAIPDLMQAAEGASTPEELKSEIARISLHAAELSARNYQSKGQTAESQEIATWGLKFGESPLLQGLVDSDQAKSSKGTSNSNTKAEIVP